MEPIYLDCNATTPIEPEVAELMRHFMSQEFGNAGSRTHEMGRRASKAVNEARRQIAELLEAESTDIIFTSGATESSNLALLGLQDFAINESRRHIITTATEHKATLEPLERLKDLGFQIEVLPVDKTGRISVDQIKSALKDETLLISIIHGNNETGVLNPIEDIAELLLLENKQDIYFHVDAAQTGGKGVHPLMHPRIDLISISAHKMYGPKGIGALIMRSRNYEKPPLKPLMLGGGQERGLRPGTLAVHLIAGFGKAAEMALKNYERRNASCEKIRTEALQAFSELNFKINGDKKNTLSNTLNLSVSGLNSEAAMIALKNIAYVSNGSACTSENYTLSHVLLAMGLSEQRAKQAIRISWSHLTPKIPWRVITEELKNLL